MHINKMYVRRVLNDRMMTWLAAICLVMVAGVPCRGDTHFVDKYSANPTPPYLDRATAAVTIQDAVDVADDGDMVMVCPGVYDQGGRTVPPFNELMNRVYIDKNITVISAGGKTHTVIQGEGPIGPQAVRGVYFDADAILQGFTITGGHTLNPIGGFGSDIKKGGGICGNGQGTVIDCVVSNNHASLRGGGAYGITLLNCSVLDNTSDAIGGGVAEADVESCVIAQNEATLMGGGVYDCIVNESRLFGNMAGSAGAADSSYLTSCQVYNNVAESWAGAVYGCGAERCTFRDNQASMAGCGMNGYFINCVIKDNRAIGETGEFEGHAGGTWGCDVYDSILENNSARHNGGGAHGGALFNCTIVNNHADDGGGGIFDADAVSCILYKNTADSGADYDVDSTLSYCCTAPLAYGEGNISADPMFLDPAHGNYRLKIGSPCIDAGFNSWWVWKDTDMDNFKRVHGETVDMGAYEFGLGDIDDDNGITREDVNLAYAMYTGYGEFPLSDLDRKITKYTIGQWYRAEANQNGYFSQVDVNIIRNWFLGAPLISNKSSVVIAKSK